ncbi:hypothetical protein WN51_04700, partial [Melipona quadrifasciata]
TSAIPSLETRQKLLQLGWDVLPHSCTIRLSLISLCWEFFNRKNLNHFSAAKDLDFSEHEISKLAERRRRVMDQNDRTMRYVE